MGLTTIEHGYVIPVSTNQVIEDGVVAFEDARIVYVGPSDKFDRRKFTPTSTINARGKAILPGLVPHRALLCFARPVACDAHHAVDHRRIRTRTKSRFRILAVA